MDKLLTNILGLKTLNLYINKFIGHYVTIYMIHRGGSHRGLSPELLEQCLIYAKNQNYHFASIDEVVNNAVNGITPNKPTLCFTLDDGFNDQVEDLVPILLKYNAKPTIFVLTNFVDNIDWPWDFKLSHMVNETSCNANLLSYKDKQFQLDFTSTQGRVTTRRALVKYAKYIPSQELDNFMAIIARELAITLPTTAPDNYKPTSWERLRHYESLGLNIGSHACSHRVFSSLGLDVVREEMIHAQSRLDSELSKPSKVFCYPSGTAKDYSTAHANLAQELGYTAAVSANPGNTTNALIKQDLYNITRHGFPHTLERFARYSSWFEVVRNKLN